MRMGTLEMYPELRDFIAFTQSYISLPGVCETGYCQIQFTSVDESSQGRRTDCTESLELDKGGTTPAVDNGIHIRIGIIVLTVSYDNVAAVTNIEADNITGSLSWYTLHLQVQNQD